MANEFDGLPASFGASIPDVFADEAVGFEVINGTVRITFGTVGRGEPVPPSEPKMQIIGRLIIPTGGAQRFCLGLYDFLKKQDLDPAQAVLDGGTTQ